MIIHHPLILVGPPGSGKTTIGRFIAQKCGISFFDLDEIIEKKYRVSIDELFSKKHESYFRLIEGQCLKEFTRRVLPERYVLATGGGTMIIQQNVKLLQALGDVVYLKSSFETIMERLSEKTRPLFKNKSKKDIETILKEREPFYEKAHRTFEIQKKSLECIFQEIIELYSREAS